MIEIKQICKSYQMGQQKLEILKGVDLKIEDGDFVAIMGPSGSGKSTMMNILGLLDVPTSGSYLFNGKEISKKAEDELSIIRREEIGFIFQQFHLLPRLSAYENVNLPILYSKKFENIQRAHEMLAKVGLSERAKHHPNELSGGQQQRVAIARAMMNNPQIILADEPTGNLDSVSEKEILKLLREMNDLGMTVIIVTHEEEIGHQAKRLIKMRDGVIQSDQRLQNLNRITQNNSFQVVPTKINSFQTPPKAAWRDVLSYFKQGYLTLVANKLRTALSMLGILIGVAAVVAMLALGKGAQKAIEEQLSSLGSNLLMIRPGSVRVAGVTQESGAANRLRYEDLSLIKSRVNYVSDASAQVNGRVQVTASAKNWNTQVQGTSPAWSKMHSAIPEIGRYFNDDENKQRARVAVIGETVRRELFGDLIPIGEMIKINKINFQIIGILPEKGANGFRDQDDIINIPVETAMKRLLGREYIDFFETQIDQPENIEVAQSGISQVLTEQHKIPLSQRDDAFQIRNMADIQAALQSSSQTMSILLSTIAAISLLVGGIGIMNIMLVSVTERTEEIGLRKSIGARRNDILAQFLSESVVISVLGGLLGIFLGWLITLVLSALTGWTTSISLSSILVSFVFSALIGIIFGVYPARKASLLNPIDALRYE